MTRLLMLSLMTMVLLGACTAQAPSDAPPQANAPADIQSIEALRTAFASAYLTGNADAIAEMYTEGGVSQGNMQPTATGRAAIAAALKTTFSQFNMKIDLFADETHTLGNAGWERGRYTLTMTPKGGGAGTTTNGRYMIILERGPDGMWRVARDIDNVIAPPVP